MMGEDYDTLKAEVERLYEKFFAMVTRLETRMLDLEDEFKRKGGF